MLDIITSCTIEQSYGLQNEVNSLRYIRGDVESVRSSLYSLTQMDGIISRLGASLGRLEQECNSLRQMGQALEKINYCYITNENKLISNAEQSVVRYTRRNLASVDLTSISGMIDGNIAIY